MKKIITVAAILLSVVPAFAQEVSQRMPISFHSILISIIIILSIVMLLVVYTLHHVVSILKHEAEGKAYNFQENEELSVWEKMLALKPLSAEKDIELDHDYDGIKELNNPIPPWFNVLFYGTIVFAIFYLLIYHVWDSAPLQAAEYNNELIAADEQKKIYLAKVGNAIDENSVVVLKDENALASGKQEFVTRCAACHGQNAEGAAVGPNLTDEYWLHGGSVNDIFKTIKYGVPSKGMVAWQSSINPVKMQEITSYILSMQGTNPPGAKEPQGEKYIPNDAGTNSNDSLSKN